METGFYLLNVSISGIKSIKKEVRLDFYKKTVDKNFNPEKYRVKAIYGENGSGKSALITAVKIFLDLICKYNYLTESRTQEFLNEIINKATNTFRFQMEFLAEFAEEKIVYQYTMQLGKGKSGLYEIQYEDLKQKNGNYANNKYQPVFESQNGELTNIICKKETAARIEKKTTNLLSTHSFIDIYFFNTDTDTLFHEDKDEYLLLSVISVLVFCITLKVYLAEDDQHELYFLGKKLKEGKSNQQIFMEGMFGKTDRLRFRFDVAVNDKFVEKDNFDIYKEKVEQLTQFIKLFKSDLVSIDIDAKEDGERYVCDLNLNYGDYIINKEFESTGIKKLIRLFDCLAFASKGGIVFVDEMDSNLNDVYLCKLIEYFMYYGKGQLCFTTHNMRRLKTVTKTE